MLKEAYLAARIAKCALTEGPREAKKRLRAYRKEQADRLVPPVEIPEIAPIVPREAAGGREAPARLNLLIPSVNRGDMYGGIATALRFLELLAAETGMETRMVVTNMETRDSVLGAEYVTVKPGEDSAAPRQAVDLSAREGTLPTRRRDVWVCTGWWTACIARELIRWQQAAYGEAEPNPSVYLIQDYEPGFYPWSSRWLLAESTYHPDVPVLAAVNTGLLMAHLEREGCRLAAAYVFEPELNPGLRAALPEPPRARKKKQVLVYGRPGTPRNAFELAGLTLRELIRTTPEAREWRYLSAGEAHPPIDLGEGVSLTGVGKLSLEEYARVMTESWAGLSLMVSPHPSYPPLEMAAFGMKVVTNRFAGKDLSGWSENIFCPEVCTPAAAAALLAEILKGYREEETAWTVPEDYARGSGQLARAAAGIAAELKERMRARE